MLCPYLGSGNPNYAGFYECDLTRTPTLCSGEIEHCQSPEAREEDQQKFRVIVIEEEPEVDQEDELIRESEIHLNWLEICDYTKHVQGK